MARFPTRENDVAVLAEDLIEGFTQHSEYFPSPPATAEELQASFQAYKVQAARPEEGVWKDVGMSVETELMVNDQERGVDLQFHVIAVNRAGEGGPSNIVRVVL